MLLLILAGVLSLQFPSVQSSLAKKLASRLSDNIDGELTIGSVRFLPFKTLIVKDVVLTDSAPVTDSYFTPRDTVLRLGSATVSFALRDLTGDKPIIINSVKASDLVLNFVLEGSGQNNIARVLRAGDSKPMEFDGDVLRIKRMEADNFRFTMVDAQNGPFQSVPQGINWTDVDVVCKARAHDLRVADNTIRIVADWISAADKSGYGFHNLKGNVEVRNDNLRVTDVVFDDDWSHLNLSYYTMYYADSLAFSNFTTEVGQTLRLTDSRLGSGTIRGFSGIDFPDITLTIPIAEASGTLDNLNIQRINFTEQDGISGIVSGTLGKITTSPESATVNASVRSLKFTTASLGALLDRLQPGSGATVASVAPNERFSLDGTVTGPLDNLMFDGDISSTAGTIAARINAGGLTSPDEGIRLGGILNAVNVELGRILGSDILGQCSMGARLAAGFRGDSYDLRIDSLQVDKLGLLGYEYRDIAAAGTFKDDSFNGRVVCSDPNLNFLFQGIFNLSNKTRNALYKFYFNLGYADLNALNLDKRGTSKASMSVNANFTRIRKGDVLGSFDIRGLQLENGEGRHDIGNISAASYTTDGNHRITFKSSFAEGSFIGTRSFPDLVSALEDIVILRELPTLSQKIGGKKKGEDYKLTLRTFNSMDLLSFVMPGLYIADGTNLNLHIDRSGHLESTMSSQRIAFEDKYLKDLSFSATDKGDGLDISLSGDELRLLSAILKDNKIRLQAARDNISLAYGFDNRTADDIFGRFNLDASLSRAEDGKVVYNLKSGQSLLHLNDADWTIDPASSISLKDNCMHVPLFAFGNGDQRLECRGGLTADREDSLMMKVNKLEIGPLGKLVAGLPEIHGQVTGNAKLKSPLGGDNKLSLTADFLSEETVLSGYEAGDIRVSSRWNDSEERMDFKVNDLLRGRETMSAALAYKPSARELSGKIDMDSLQVGYASGFLTDVFKTAEGKACGEILLSGPIDNISVSSRDTRLYDGVLHVAFTDVPYYVSGPFHVDDSGLHFDDMDVRDRYSGTGKVNGGILFNHFRDFSLDTYITAKDAEVFNVAQPDDLVPVYGHLFADGLVHLKGPFESVLMSAAATDSRGNFHISIPEENAIAGTNLLTFKEEEKPVQEDPYEAMLRQMQAVQSGQNVFNVKMKVAVTPEVDCHLEIDKESGNVLNGRGYGDISLDIGADRFNILGDYSMSSGNFHFNAMNIASRNFNIRSGSSIKFNGDIMESDLDIDAGYITKASLANLVTDTTAVTSRRNVECGLRISDKLKNPRLAFSIDIPDLDPSTKSSVENALSTEDKVQKQFLALLVTNSFLPDDQSGIFNNSNLLMSNVMEVMSGQLSNMLQRLQIPLDLGLKYQSAEGGTDIFDVAVSTQLFNDRVSVNGIIGNRQYSTDETGRDVVGDLDIEMKLDKPGAVRLKLFSHSADKYSNYLDYSQRNGIGIGYQKEFNSLKDLFRKRNKTEQDGTERNNNTMISIQEDGK